MYCRKPFIKGGFPFPCGQCFPCKMNKRATWAHRIMLEAACHPNTSFITLTYNEDEMPRLEDGRGTLVRKDAQDFLKRIRENLRYQNSEYKIRFFCVGEYGGDYERPHFHIVLFNYKCCGFGLYRNRIGPDKVCCPQCNLVYKSWKKGFITNEPMSMSAAEYCARYAVKKMTREDDVRLKGRAPEFARMSLKPGLGHDFMFEVASTLLEYPDTLKDRDVPTRLRHGAKMYPLGPYLRKKLREFVGRDPSTPDFVMEDLMATLRPLQEEAERILEKEKVVLDENHRTYAQIYRQLILDQKEQMVASMEARYKIFQQRDRMS